MKLEKFAEITLARLPIRNHTKSTYLSAIRVHIQPTIGHLELDEISRSQIKDLLAGLPSQTANLVLAVIKMLFREALELELLDKSPVHGIKGPRIMVKPRRFLTWEEMENLDFGKYTTQIRFLALHGLRWSEAVALTSDDIRNGQIFVTKSVHGSPKSYTSMRVVPLVSDFKTFPKHPRTLRKVLHPHGISIHSLRHTYAYVLKRQGIHVTTAQRLLGHSDPKITLAVYTRVLDSELDEAGTVLKKMLKSAHSLEMSESNSSKNSRT